MKVIPHNRPTLGRKEAAAAAQTVGSGWIAPSGPQTAAFEFEVANFLGLNPENVLAKHTWHKACLHVKLS